VIAGASGPVAAAATALVGEPLPTDVAAVPVGGLRRLDPAATRFRLGPEGHLQLLLPELCHRRATLVRPFPLRRTDEWLSVRGPDGREIGLLPGLGELDADSRQAAEAHLRLRYFVPRITAIRGLRDESDGGRSGGLLWDLETDRGPTSLHMPNTNEYIQDLGGGRLLLSDRAGSRFEIASVSALDAASRARLARFVWL